MELKKFWQIILGHKWSLILFVLVATSSAVGLTYALPELYESTALVLVRPKESLDFVPGGKNKEVMDFPLSQAAPVDAPSKTYIEVIQSRAVAERVVRALNLDQEEPKTFDSYWEELKETVKIFIKDTLHDLKHYFKYGRIIELSPFEEAVENIQENVSMQTVKNTYVFKISYLDKKPERAAAVANALANIFLEYNAESNKAEARINRVFLRKRVNEAAKELENARRALEDFKNKNKTFLLTEEYQEELTVLTELQKDLEKTNAKLASLQKKYQLNSVEVKAVQAEKNQILRSIEQRTKSLELHPGKEKVLQKLLLQVSVAESSYSFLYKELEDARIEEVKHMNEIRMVSPAKAANYPKKPIKYYFGGGAFILSLVLGIAFFAFKESQVALIRSIDDVENDLQIHVIGTIPKARF